MKRLFLFIVLFVGVGFAMMGSPAQVCDDNVGSAEIGAAVQSATNTPKAPVHQGRDYIKHEWKVKKDVDFTKTKRTIIWPGSRSDLFRETTQISVTSLQNGPLCIILKPKPIKKPEEPCSPSHGSDGLKNVIESGKHYDLSGQNTNEQEASASNNPEINKPRPHTRPVDSCGAHIHVIEKF